MKVKKGFNLRNVCGEDIIVAEGEENIDFSNIISMNESSAKLWREAQAEDDFTVQSLTDYLCSVYEVEREVARKDVETLVAQWAVAGIIEGDDLPDVSNVEVKKVESASNPVPESSQAIQQETKPKKKGFFARLFGK